MWLFSPYIWLSLYTGNGISNFSPDKYFALLLNICLKQARVLFYIILGRWSQTGKQVSLQALYVLYGLPMCLFFNCCTEPLYTLLMALLIFVYFKVSVKNKSLLHSCVLYLLLGFLCAAANAIRPMVLCLLQFWNN